MDREQSLDALAQLWIISTSLLQVGSPLALVQLEDSAKKSDFATGRTTHGLVLTLQTPRM
jgi:hypothetical protein